MFYEDSAIIEKFNIEQCSVVVFKKTKGKSLNSSSKILRYPVLIARKAYNFLNVSIIPFVKFLIFAIKMS